MHFHSGKKKPKGLHRGRPDPGPGALSFSRGLSKSALGLRVLPSARL